MSQFIDYIYAFPFRLNLTPFLCTTKDLLSNHNTIDLNTINYTIFVYKDPNIGLDDHDALELMLIAYQ